MSGVTQHARFIAREVIAKAAKNRTAGLGPEDRLDFDSVLRERFPCRGSGGVAMANGRTQREVRAAIIEFYEPPSNEA